MVLLVVVENVDCGFLMRMSVFSLLFNLVLRKGGFVLSFHTTVVTSASQLVLWTIYPQLHGEGSAGREDRILLYFLKCRSRRFELQFRVQAFQGLE